MLIIKLYHTSWNTRRCRVNKVIKMYFVLLPSRHPLSPVANHCHCCTLSSHIVTRYHSLSPVITRPHPLLPVVTRSHLLSPVTTPLDELTHAYA